MRTGSLRPGRIIIVMATILAVLAGGVTFFVMSRGASLATAELRRVTGMPVRIGRVTPGFPFGVVLSDVVIGRVLKVPRVHISWDAVALWRGQLRPAFVDLDAPEINIDAGRTMPATGAGVAASVTAPGRVTTAGPGRGAVLERVRIENGRVMLQIPETGKTWIVEKVRADITQVPLDGTPGQTWIRATASLAAMDIPFIGTQVAAEGWVNWAARDMNAHLNVSHGDGHVGLEAALVSRSNVLDVKGRVILTRDQRALASGRRSRMVEGALLDMLAATGTDINAGFSFQTAMDRFDPGRIKIEGAITTELHSGEISGNIVGNLKAAGAQFLRTGSSVPTIEPEKLNTSN